MAPTWLKKTLRKVLVFKAFITKLFKYYVTFRKAAPFISGLILVHAWVEYALVAILIVHLTDNWLSLPKAALIVNVLDGLTALLALIVAHASDAHLGPYRAVVFTTIAYISGLLLLFFAAWRLQRIETQLLNVSVILIALGRAGRDIPLKEFLADQFRGNQLPEYDEEQLVESRRKVWWRSAYMLGIGASVYVFANASWIKLSKISVMAMAAAFVLFLVGIVFYECKKPTKYQSNMNMLRVIYAVISKRHLSHATTATDHLLDIPKLRWLDKAIIQEPSLSIDEQVRKGRLCTIEQVNQVKILFTLVPLWTTFLIYGLLQATGSTFFYEQLNYMDTHLGRISRVPFVIFVIIKTSTSFIVSRLCDSLFSSCWGEKIPRHIMLVRVGIGMGLSPICCVVAWGVESYRLRQYVNHDISISFGWLVPQFFLLGFMEGLVFDGMEEFYCAHAPKSLNKYGPPFTLFALNIGNFISLASILIFHGLFADDLNSSSLGTYYAMLAYVCFVNLLFYCCVATYYVKKAPLAPGTEQQLELQPEQFQSLEGSGTESIQQEVE